MHNGALMIVKLSTGIIFAIVRTIDVAEWLLGNTIWVEGKDLRWSDVERVEALQEEEIKARHSNGY